MTPMAQSKQGVGARTVAGRWRAAARWWLPCALAAALAGPVAAQTSREYDLKAVFLYNFATFVEWPDDALPGNKPFTIGVLGSDPFGTVLDRVIVGEQVKGHPLAVRRCKTPAEARECQIVFISGSEASRLPEILRTLHGLPVLTVADMPRFLEAGGVIGFSTEARVQLHVNLDAARQARLNISSKLMRVANVHDPGAPP
ncbi:MAG: YfiR family protein [Lacunisphaera sp.]|nr:YfiR family protein [Lacunisphaera sp.]MDB6165289.1 YfiR family protein [Lacunisphaera sp.]